VSHLSVGPVHHMRIAVTDVGRSQAFYTEVLVDSLQGGVILMHQGMFFGLRPVDDERAAAADHFDPFRVGLDHLSFAVPARADLDAAAHTLDQLGIEHGPVRDLPPLGMSFLAFFDPDGIALELTAPIADPV